ncbi:MAG: hypothetical protein IKK63_00135 [Clostridia bacterium]|nr:hypothetical protein [Clostridia bacterium]MBR3817635.1 hypothetical protein [Clostridia bacterium]
MKKNKNEKPKAEAKKESVIINDIPSEKIREESIEEKEFPFKKVLYGYSPEEVTSFVSEMSKTYEASLSLNESKLSSLKEELALANRERDYYIEKCRKAKNEPVTVSDKSGELEAIIAQLKDKISSLESENKFLKNKPVEEESKEIYIKKTAELEEKLAYAKNENLRLSQQAAKYEELHNEYKAIIIQSEETKLHLEATQKELKEKQAVLNKKTEMISVITLEKEEAEKKLSECEIRNSILTQHIAEAEKEVATLKETNKSLVFENAEKINTLENEYSKNKLAVQKEIKLYRYYVDRAELTVAELTKQMEQIRQSIENTEI